jgi:hypothetical protein
VFPASRCVVLVPVGGAIGPDCEDALRELEQRGYPVWRVSGYSAVDAARNQMANDALAQRFDELMWIDSDIVFDPDDVDKLRRHDLPLVCGLYPKKACRQFACAFLPDTRQLSFGDRGGLTVQPPAGGGGSSCGAGSTTVGFYQSGSGVMEEVNHQLRTRAKITYRIIALLADGFHSSIRHDTHCV